MRYPAKYPSWGVLVKAPADKVWQILLPLRERYELWNFDYRTSNGWTAVFNMEPSDTGDDEAAELLRQHGFVPVYRFDFSKYEYLTWHWDGEQWNQDKDPLYVLGDVGIDVPGWDEPPIAPDPRWAVVSREASVIEGASVEEVCAFVPDQSLRINPGPLGAIVYDADVNTRILFWERAPARVFEFLYYPKSGKFRFQIMKGNECLGTFKPGETRTWDGTPFLANVEGETTPERIIDKFGIPRSFLEPLAETDR
jgi:hypothetical protein